MLSGPILSASPSLMTSIESATSATEFIGSMATLTGGPTTEFFSGRFATIFGFSGSARSTISTESFPAGDMIGLLLSSHNSFSSFPTIISGVACATLTPTDAKNATAHNKDHECLIGMMALSR